jgi:hypothetical protein
MDMETQIRQALARGYCTPENEKKELDAELINAMTKEVLESFQPRKTDPCDGCHSAPMDCPGPEKCGYVGGNQD